MNTPVTSIKNYFSLVKFSHTVFAMPFAIIGFTLGITQPGYSFSFKLLVLIILCMVFARNAAMGFNRIADRKWDALNPRTSGREIPSGKIAARAAIAFVISNAVLFIATTWFINRLTFFLSPVALFIILIYSLLKRITSLCHFVLGLGLSLAPIGAFISVTGRFNILPVLYSFVVITWVSGFDIIYSLQDDEFDRENKLFSIPAVTGRKRALGISVLVHSLTVLMVITAGISGHRGIIFWAGAFIFTSLLVYQHLLVKADDLKRVNMAFATMNGVAGILFAIFTIIDLLF